MVTVKSHDDDNVLSKCANERLACPHLCSKGSLAGTKIPVYCFGTQSLVGNSLFGGLSDMSEEQSLLDSLLLAQWEERMWKGHIKYDVTASEIKIIRGRQKFLAQLTGHWSMDCTEDSKKQKLCHQEDLLVFDQAKHCEELLFCITKSDQAESKLVPSASVPNGAFLIIVNVNPIEYGHVFLVPHGFNSLYQVMNAKLLEMVARVVVEINNFSLRMFYDSPGSTASHTYFQACYFPDILPVEHMPVDSLYGDGNGGIRISTLTDYPIKTLVFESNYNLMILVDLLAETCSFLVDKDILYNLMISDRGKKIFLFLQVQSLSTSLGLGAWECAGYFLFRSMQEFDQVTEAVLLKRLSTVSLDDEGFKAVKLFCCSIAAKIAG